jgi:acyl-CoA hydrolase
VDAIAEYRPKAHHARARRRAGLERQPCNVTNDPVVIAANDDVISINSILEADLYGRVNAEFLAEHEFGGVGGQHDFVRGAYRSRGGKSFLAFYSTAHGGTVARIVPRLEGVVTDPPLARRADFRDDLEREAKKLALL